MKELLENALDAGATDVRVELTGGGCGSIRVSDNGGGIDPSDVPKAFERYATSKIYEFDDIYRVETFGFRGEALPSIASIARVEMITRKGTGSPARGSSSRPGGSRKYPTRAARAERPSRSAGFSIRFRCAGNS